jgi:VWFA-related protein
MAQGDMMRILRAGIVASALAVCLGAFPAAQVPQKPAAPQQPTFKAGVSFVRVDVYPSVNGQIVSDLRKDEFEVLEDGVPQRIETFERVVIRAPGPEAERAEPRSAEQGNQAAADSRNRLFVLFLDSYHTTIDASRTRVTTDVGPQGGKPRAQSETPNSRIGRALATFLGRLIGPDDLIAVTRPELPVESLSFTRRPSSFETVLLEGAAWQRRPVADDWYSPDDLDQTEKRYVACYARVPDVAYEMIARRRERMVLSALRNIVRHLQTLREERKAILVVSEGWRLFGPDDSLLGRTDLIRRPQIGIAGGQPTIGDQRDGVPFAACDGDRTVLAGIDDRLEFRDLLDEANRSNASFYPIDPRGLPVFDTAIPTALRSAATDRALLRGNLESLQTLAVNTDGVAIVNSNDFAKNLRRISDDLSSYYLLGYNSTNTKFNGKFRKITVRVKRPGVSVRARRGYLAPTEAEVKAAEAASAPPPDSRVVALESALGTLDLGRPNQVLLLRGGYTWRERPAASPDAVLSVVVELDAAAARAPGWAGGGQLAASLVDPDGRTLASSTATVSPTSRSCLIRFTDSPLPPGTYFARVKAQWSVLTTTEQVRIEVPDVSATSGVLGQPIVFRRGPYTGAGYQPTADLRFRKAERIRLDVPVAGATDSIAGELLDRKGQALPVPVATTRREEGGMAFITAEVVLAPLAPGDYVIEVTGRRGEKTETALTAIRIVP